jgi:hypothetical protein
MILLVFIYFLLFLCFKEWENPRTQTEFNDSLVLKIFAFQFVNNYGSLYYIAFVRQVKFLEFHMFLIFNYLFLLRFLFLTDILVSDLHTLIRARVVVCDK